MPIEQKAGLVLGIALVVALAVANAGLAPKKATANDPTPAGVAPRL